MTSTRSSTSDLTSDPAIFSSVALLYCAIAAAFSLVPVAGCGQSPTNALVHGSVTYQGEALGNATLTFFPEMGRPIYASISESGEYQVELPPGEYTVAVNVSELLPEGFKEGDLVPPQKTRLPPQYTTRARSTLTASVGERGPQQIDIALQ